MVKFNKLNPSLNYPKESQTYAYKVLKNGANNINMRFFIA